MKQDYKYLRQPFGKNHYNSRLSPSEVREILELSQFIPCPPIAEAYGVSTSTVYFIKTGVRWAKFTKVRKSVISTPHKKPRKVSKIKAKNIKKAHKMGQSQCKLAKKYKVSQPVIFDIVHGRTHV